MNLAVTADKSRGVSFLEYLVVFLLVFYAGKASLFVLALENWDNIIGLILPIAAITALGFVKGVQFNHRYWFLILGFTLYFIASTIKFGELHPRFYGILVINFTLVYVTISGLRYRFFKLYENILVFLCAVAIIFWTIQNLMPATFIEILRNFEFSRQPEIKGNVDFNVIVYTVSNFEKAPNMILHFGGIQLFRNAGFAWEPGAFSMYVNIAILFNLIRNKFRLKGNWHLLVLVIALATTFSTTGYSMFILLVMLYIYNQNLVKAVWLAPLVVGLSLYIFSLPFMAEKIEENIEFNTEELIYYSAKYNNMYSPQRFESLKIDFKDFLNHPIIGYGGHLEARWTRQLGANISSVSGIGKVMAQFGIVGILFFFMSLYLSSRQLASLYGVKGSLFIMVFVLLISISYSILTPLFMCIWLLYLPSFFKTEVVKRYVMHHLLKRMNA